ncbi:thiamine pyrophosphate binding domain-containing protein [Calothrix sp. NIES-4071]|nr:thiamine pyrophosphate binding domain-containing protein [Calothrix sp. NIES-4071]BAZ56201.1 thiamine pyrophosphate binding domain-containing protein [Calothrix sp. NIES-4105]
MFAQMYEKVTAAQAYLTPENATAEIDRVLGVCLLKKLPSMLDKASKPVIIADLGVERYHLQEELRSLLDATGYPYATMTMGKGLLEETHPQFIGIYDGAVRR